MSKYRNPKDYAAAFKALANPHRLAIFTRLAACCSPKDLCDETGLRACVSELGRNLGIAPSTISHHLKELHGAGLLRMQRKGRNIECWVEAETLESLSGFFRKAGRG